MRLSLGAALATQSSRCASFQTSFGQRPQPIGKDCVELGDTFHVSLAVAAHTVRGMSKSAEFPTWRGMRSRRDNRADPAYHNYGGRGISYCQRRAEFENFLQGHESLSATAFRFPFTGDGSFLPGVPFAAAEESDRRMG